MINWKNASEEDLKLLEGISILFGRNKRLLGFFFHPSKALLRRPASVLKREMGALSSGEQLLLMAGLDVWSHEGSGIHFDDLYRTLSPCAFKNCLESLIYIKRNIY